MMKALLLGCISLGGIHIQIGQRALEYSTLLFSPLSDLRQQINLGVCMIYYLLRLQKTERNDLLAKGVICSLFKGSMAAVSSTALHRTAAVLVRSKGGTLVLKQGAAVAIVRIKTPKKLLGDGKRFSLSNPLLHPIRHFEILLEQFTPKATALCRGERQSSVLWMHCGCVAFDSLYLLALQAVHQPQGAACVCWLWVYTPKV